MAEMTPQDIADCLEMITERRKTNKMQETVAMQAANYMRKIAAEELKPVVHCKDCINHYACDTGWPCDITGDDDFCSKGKKKS